MESHEQLLQRISALAEYLSEGERFVALAERIRLALGMRVDEVIESILDGEGIDVESADSICRRLDEERVPFEGVRKWRGPGRAEGPRPKDSGEILNTSAQLPLLRKALERGIDARRA